MSTCMGGWCHLRDKCRHHAPVAGQPVRERMCSKDKTDAFKPIVVTKPPSQPKPRRLYWTVPA